MNTATVNFKTEPEIKEDKPAIEAEATLDAPAETDAPKAKAPKKKKAKRNISSGQLHILATFNNTIVTVTDEKGNVLGIQDGNISSWNARTRTLEVRVAKTSCVDTLFVSNGGIFCANLQRDGVLIKRNQEHTLCHNIPNEWTC